MAKIRFGYSDDFTAKNSGVGINTTDSQANLDVVGVVKGQDLKVTGISSQTGYEGFLIADHQIEENTQLNFGQGINASLSGEIIVGTGQTVTVTENLKEDRFGPELITNGQFLSNVDNWTANDSSNSLNNGRMRITRSGGNGRATYQIITSLVPGATYFASAIVDSIGSRGDFRVKKGSLWTNDAYLLTSGTSGQVKTLSGSFTATGTTALVGFAIDNNSTVIEVDQVTVRRVNDVEEPGTNVAGGSQVECMKVYNTFTPPSGDTSQRPSKPKPGQLYYNYDFKTIEFFDGYGWRQVDNTTRSGRGVFMAGFDPGFDLSISYINISSRGNTQNFGEVTPNMGGGCAGLGNATRGLVAGGFAPSYHDVIEYITIAAGGNSIDFGNLTDARRYASGASSSTRGVFAGGYSPGVVNVIDYVEITTIGNALDFGDLSEQGEALGTATSPTRACFAGGRHPQTDEFIDYITMASTGDAIDFGDLSQARQNMCYHTSSSSTRGIFGGGIIPAQVNTIDYITIAATGNAIDFGDLTVNRRLGFNVSTQTRAVFAGGYNTVTSMDYVTIATAGDAIDFGEITSGQLFSGGACSDSHGGLGGF